MIASALGWKLDRIEEKIEPKIAEKAVASNYIKVEPGQVAGLDQTAWGLSGGEQVITLNLQAYLGCPDPCESILVEGHPPIDLTIRGGIHGDFGSGGELHPPSEKRTARFSHNERSAFAVRMVWRSEPVH
jgi:4-hydroxy-tetrahydrodipicolinate reductase